VASFTSLAAFERELGAMSKEVLAAKKRKILMPMAERAQRIVAAQVAADLTQSDFSGWRRGAPIKLETNIKPLPSNAMLVAPTKKTAGPFTVLDVGRNPGDAGLGPVQGPMLTRTGRISRARRKRFNGQTKGKGSSAKAVAAIDAAMPAVAEDGIRQVMVRHFDVS